jgi:spectrin alpha
MADELGKDVASAHALLQQHKEYKGEIDARDDSFQAIADFGQSLIAKRQHISEGVPAKLEAIDTERKSLLDLWQKRQLQLEHSYDLQVFLRDSEQVDSWVTAQESTLASEELGDTLDSVEPLIKAHDDFEKSLVAQMETMKALEDFASRLLAYNHYDSAAIKKRRDAVLARRAQLDQISAARKAKLQESLRFQQFKRDAEEASAWINEKLRTASDESFRDPTNLRGKLQNHQAFEAELKANEGLIAAVNTTGLTLVSARHYAADAIAARQAELNADWKSLLDHSQQKGTKLKEANQYQQYARRVEDIMAWCSDVQQSLGLSDFGRDLTDVQNLLKKHALLEAEIQGQQDRIEALATQAKEFVAAGNFQASIISEKQAELTQVYQGLAGPCAARRKKLEDSLKLQQFFRDVDDEEAWIRDKVPIASSYNYGNSLSSVQNLIKKHSALKAELEGRIKRIKAIEDIASGLVHERHYASTDVQSRLQGLKDAWADLNQAAVKRQSHLDDSLRAQQYFADANETEAWMTEKEPIISNPEYGQDEDSAQALLKKHEAVESDLHAYLSTIDNLGRVSKTCKDLPVFETGSRSSLILQSNVPSVRAKFQYKASQQQEISLAVGEIYELVDKTTPEWWSLKSATATGFAPAAYLEEIIAEPDAHAALNSSSSSTSIEASASARQQTLSDLYQKLTAKAAVRRTKLEESQQLHQLNRECDEVVGLVQDRMAIALQQDVGADLEHCELIQKKFDDYLKDLAANEARVASVNDLANKFVQQGHSDSAIIQARREELNSNWLKLQQVAAARSKSLAGAHEVHLFNRDVTETVSRFNEKNVILSLDEYGKDVPTVEAHQRKHESAMRDLAALEGKVQGIHTEATRLVGLHPADKSSIEGKVAEIDSHWASLQAKAASRKTKLEDSLNFQKFLNDARDLAAWISSMQTLASSEELAQDAGGAEDLLKRYQELKTEIDAHVGTIEAVKTFGKKLVAANHFASPEIAERLTALNSQLQTLHAQLGTRKHTLDQCKELQSYNRIAEQAEAWIATREPQLTNDDHGSSLDAVEAQLKKHSDFEKSVDAQREKIGEIDREASRLVAASHYASDAIAERQGAVDGRFVMWQWLR